MSKKLFFAAALPLFALLAAGCGAAIEPPRDASDRVVPVVERVKAHDTFWAEEKAAENRRPPPERPRSISLGYVGQGKLAGGVGRDDYVETMRPAGHGPMTWQEYASSPNWRTNGGRGLATPAYRGCRGGCAYGSSGYGLPLAPPVQGSPTY